MRGISVMKDGSFALGVADTYTSIALTTTAQAVAVPASATHAFFSATQNFMARYNSTAAASIASFSSADSTGSELNPTVRFLGKNQIAEVSIIGQATGFASIAWFNSGST